MLRAVARWAGVVWFGLAAAAFGGEPIPFAGQLGGRVSTPAGLPQMGASVALFNRYDAVIARTLTNEGGGFEFSILPAGIYSVQVSLP